MALIGVKSNLQGFLLSNAVAHFLKFKRGRGGGQSKT